MSTCDNFVEKIHFYAFFAGNIDQLIVKIMGELIDYQKNRQL